ncbi:phospholipase [Spirilliplanes yamanashiensis]|uniref:Phospholipase A2 n=1 Tax=Spirilliplanes yamanashiensis TaxID=42233 RepID=A0A8J3Y3C9_9ACTN|nr:phospholipase [Spirilliplanes yamanashiensis]MDP9814303.1 opacity protein-like surface antigen [Spirilliplanes yamanashiensis]GIJ00714.1 hypothetical protein Sya03_00660 [Spirilliplanes yamanashiensis]
MPAARRALLALLATAALVLGLANPAAAATAAQKLAVLSSWTQTSAASYAAWNTARADRGAWGPYGFDWTTDDCSSSPDRPLGFDFRLACKRHDFGYRNYKKAGLFAANRARLDNAFHADLKRKCATYSPVVRPACYSLAWTYYTAVDAFGSLAAVEPADVERAERLIG